MFRSPLTAWMFADDDKAKATRAGFLARVPKGRLGEPEDLAGPLLFLASRAQISIPAIRYMRMAATRRAERMVEKPAIAVIGAGLMGAGIALVFAAGRSPCRAVRRPGRRAGNRVVAHPRQPQGGRSSPIAADAIFCARN